MKILNRIKSLYYFWKLTRKLVDKNNWLVETGYNSDNTKWYDFYTPNEWMSVNHNKE